ncbi:prolipoprotein diacylglyceryl transferase family protein [Georgenia daeguensis]|uniref:Diacylglyceryl transferase n=1 Tax=Georgenia daeguensis TaxID=908355 RepID=A0ABP6USB1_9MICO
MAATVAVAEPSAVAPRLARHTPHSPVVITDLNCSALDDADQQSLGVTYWFDAEPTGDPYTMTVHLSGRLKVEAQAREGRTAFAVTSTVENVVPGSGRVAVTTRIPHLTPGEWEVTATPVKRARARAAAPWVEVRSPRTLRGTASGRTALPAFVNNLAPGVFLGAWPALVSTGVVLALVIQMLLARQLDLPAVRVFLLTAVASLLGLFAAKGYFLLTHPHERRTVLTPGMSVQGFVIVTIGTLSMGSLVLAELPLGALLDVTAPGLLFAMAVGRLGCLLGGCCVGRPTTSRWGIWSSDRRVGIRRIPVQLLESALSAVLGTLALLVVLQLPTSGDGLVLVATVAAYVLGRQLLFPLRSIPRATVHGRTITLLVAAVVLGVTLWALL